MQRQDDKAHRIASQPGAPSRLRRIKTMAAFALAFILMLGWGALEAVAQGRKQKESDQDINMRNRMVAISRQLGVTCTHCHNMDNLKSDAKKEFKVAKDHMRITALLNKDGFKGQPQVDCFLCHRGVAKPEFKEKVP